jgi:glycerol uptake facilitator-like aquaporin
MEAKLRTYLAETFGTFVVVAVAAGAVCSAYLEPEAAPGSPPFYTAGGLTVAAALAEGFALAVAVTFTSYLSPGCCNPAVTLALFITRKLDLRPTLALIAAQLSGSVLAGLLLRSLYSNDVLARSALGAPHLGAIPGADAPTFAAVGVGILLEALFAFVVTMAAFATLIDRRAPRVGGLGLGLAQTAVVLFGFRLTGGSANPARWFGPTLWRLSLDMPQVTRPLAGQTVYWAGPVIGAMAAAVLYVSVILPPERK